MGRRMSIQQRVEERSHWEGDCLIWDGYVRASGYGGVSVRRDGKKTGTNVHRALYEEVHGELPDDRFVCHRCDRRRCVNLKHLFVGTPADNIEDARRKGRLAKGERHGRTPLTVTDVVAMREQRACGASLNELARTYGITIQSISAIVQRRSWRHVP